VETVLPLLSRGAKAVVDVRAVRKRRAIFMVDISILECGGMTKWVVDRTS